MCILKFNLSILSDEVANTIASDDTNDRVANTNASDDKVANTELSNDRVANTDNESAHPQSWQDFDTMPDVNSNNFASQPATNSNIAPSVSNGSSKQQDQVK